MKQNYLKFIINESFVTLITRKKLVVNSILISNLLISTKYILNFKIYIFILLHLIYKSKYFFSQHSYKKAKIEIIYLFLYLTFYFYS